MENDKCYVFGEGNARPAKRRRIEPQGLAASLALRKRVFRAHWNRQHTLLNNTIRNTNAEVLNNLHAFFSTPNPGEVVPRIPTALVLTNPGALTHGTLYDEIRDSVLSSSDSTFVSITAAEAPNLKTFLKNLISKTTEQPLSSNDDIEELFDPSSGSRLLKYDVEILHQWCNARKVQKVIIMLRDVETFDVGVLTDFLNVLHSWLDRITFVLLCGLATSVDIFHEKLPTAALRRMKGDVFDVTSSEALLEEAFAACAEDEDDAVRLGPGLADLIFQRQNDCGQSIDSLADSLKYTYMCHFYGNALSVFLSEDVEFKDVTKEHFEGLRNLPSFQKYAEDLLDDGQASRVKELLESDERLFDEVKQSLKFSQSTVCWLLSTLKVIRTVMTQSSSKPPTFSALYIKALRGELAESPLIRELLLFVKKSPSDVMAKILPDVIDVLMTAPPGVVDVSPADFRDIEEQLENLTQSSGSTKAPMKSEHDVRQNTLRTTVVAQKVELSKQKSTLSKQDSAYTELLLRLQDLLSDLFSKTLIPMTDIFLHEIMFCDLKAPYRDSFAPRTRFAIERALSAPHDYLGCSCCAVTEERLVSTQPPTAILYQLYLESGALINAFDLWSAFNAVAGEQNEDEEMTMALFFRALAELRHLGMIRQSRKKIDHLAKLAWKGL